MRSPLRARALAVALATAALAAAALSPTAPAGAQSAERAPKRPRLKEGSDTNSAGAYYFDALGSINRAPARAADGFYWAARIEPTLGDASYARWVALLLANKPNLLRYYFGDPAVTQSKQQRRADSLYLRALLRDPFFAPRLDKHVTDEVIYQLTDGDPTQVSMASADPRVNAWRAYEQGRFAEAARYYAAAVKAHPKQHWLRQQRARALFLSQQYDSTVAELERLLEIQRTLDAKKLVYIYESKAMTEFQIGWTQARLGNLPAAREAYGRALVEDLAFYRAHEALGDVALAQGDTAVALQEYDQAVQIHGADAVLREKYALLLVRQQRADDAAAQFRGAIEAEPYYARPYLYLARILELQEKPEALDMYRAFIARANRDDGQLERAKQQLAEFEVFVALKKQ